MFILLKSGAMLNLFWMQDCFQGKHNKNIVVFYMVNGTKLTEEYSSESEAEARVNEIHIEMDKANKSGAYTKIVNELPEGEDIDEDIIYLVPTGDERDMLEEWVYVYGKWNPWGVKRLELDNYYTIAQIDSSQQAQDTLITDLDERLEALTERVTTSESNIQTNATAVQSEATTRTEQDATLQANIDAVQTSVNGVQSNVDTLTRNTVDRFIAVGSNITSLSNDLATTQNNLVTTNTTLKEDTKRLTDLINELTQTVSDLTNRVEALESGNNSSNPEQN